MIFLQLLAIVALIPATIILLMSLQIFSLHKLFFLMQILFVLFYALIIGLIFKSYVVGICSGSIILILMLTRSFKLYQRLKAPRWQSTFNQIAKIKIQKRRFVIEFFVFFSFFDLFRNLPENLNKILKEELSLDVSVSDFVNQLLTSSVGTVFEFSHENDLILLEIY